ncbi:MAG: tRNA (guanosine(46)-N7)-methyltransferase TrmB [Spirochaetales bacterium]|nr:tRNA (guanosine(46)-N7)-methyltransferase TrmB [Spirochaetales bacterium]
MTEERRIKSYVIRGGRMTEGRKRALAELYGIYGLQFGRNYIDISALTPPGRSPERVVAEIGFGTGEATVSLAAENPDTLYIGIEVFPAGVGTILREIHERGIRNIRVIRYDAAEVVRWMLPESSIDGFHIFFPDPWPKKKHHKRRLLNTEFLELLLEKMKPGGYLYVVTDWDDYAAQISAACEGIEGFENTWPIPAQSRRPATKYEKKGLAQGRQVREIYFTKKLV